MRGWSTCPGLRRDIFRGPQLLARHVTAPHAGMVLAVPASLLHSQDGNGYIDENELDALLKDLCEKNKQVIN